MSNNIVEYFENELCEQHKVDYFNMSHRKIVVLVGHNQTVDSVRNDLWILCRKLESEMEIEFDFNNNTKIFAIIRREKERIYHTRVYLYSVSKTGFNGLRPDVIVVYGDFLAKQVGKILEFVQRNSYTKGLEVKFLNR